MRKLRAGAPRGGGASGRCRFARRAPPAPSSSTRARTLLLPCNAGARGSLRFRPSGSRILSRSPAAAVRARALLARRPDAVPEDRPPPGAAHAARFRGNRDAAATDRHAAAVPGTGGRPDQPRQLAHARLVPGSRSGRAARPRPLPAPPHVATEALAAGVSIFELSRMMGASVKTIDKNYGHLAHDSEASIRDRLATRRHESGVYLASDPDA